MKTTIGLLLNRIKQMTRHGKHSNELSEEEIWKTMWENAEKIYVSKEAYDRLVEMINRPPTPEQIESIRKLMQRKAPWD
jgi:hypothetical protein